MEAPKNGRVSLSGTTLNAKAKYSCFPGYSLQGDDTRICEPDGQWGGSAPVCVGRSHLDTIIVLSWPAYYVPSSSPCPARVAVDCGPLPPPKNGQVSLTSTTLFSVATYECERGFGLVGVSSRVCQSDGKWSEKEPICERKSISQLV